MALLRSAPGVTFDLTDGPTTDSYAHLVDKADGIVIRTQPMPAVVVKAAPRLKIVSRHGVGYDAVDVEALTARGIPLAIVGDVNSRAVAEHTLMLMLAVARRTVAYEAASRGGNWNVRNRFETVELDGKTLLLIGFGRIGRRVAVLAQAFGMNVFAHDPFVGPEAFGAAKVEFVKDINGALGRADFLSVHMPPSPKGALIGERELAMMKSSAIVINTARGGLIDERAVDAALRGNRLGGAGFDVFGEEPPHPDHPFLSNPLITISPHNAGLTQECAARMAVASVQNVLNCFNGKLDERLVVNAAALRGR
jgi:D-3-phosphoglycerate dehydrogenase